MSPSTFLPASPRNAMITIALSGALWGLFWIPLRGLSEVGLVGAWATVGFTGTAALVVLAYSLVCRRRQLKAGGGRLFLTGALAGAAMMLYSNALLFTEVVHAFLLFYMMPVWSMLLARIFLHERITVGRLVSIALGLAGLLTILGVGEGIPWPKNIGDWMGLSAGFFWSTWTVRLRQDHNNQAEEQTAAFLICASLLALLITLLPHPAITAAPDSARWLEAIPLLAAIALIFVVPSVFFMVWGSRLISPGVAGILFMTEVTVGILSAALFAGEPFGWREGLGVFLIASAGVIGCLAPSETVRQSR